MGDDQAQDKKPAMGFSFDQLTENYQWPVTVKLPRGGDYREFQFMATFRLVPQDEVTDLLQEITDRFKALIEEGESIPNQKDWANKEFLARVWVGWDGSLTADRNGTPMPYSEESARKWLDWPAMYRAIDQAYTRSAGGQEAVKEN